tara:strand:- start:1107 stop:1460 length:354 start_codon:yes stop_codon:yes gene_type:complete
MPNFKKNTDYSMKGSTFYGKGNSSPLKVSDSQVVDAQDKLDHIEHDYRTPGWATAVGKVFGGGGGKQEESKDTTEGDGTEKKTKKVKTDHKLEVNKDLMAGGPKLETGSMGTGGFGG